MRYIQRVVSNVKSDSNSTNNQARFIWTCIILFLSCVLFVTSCAKVVHEEDAIVLKAKIGMLVIMFISGIIIFPLGVYVVVKIMPSRLRDPNRTPWQRRKALRLISLPIIGFLLMTGVAPWAAYSIKVDPESLTIKGIGVNSVISNANLKHIEEIPGNSGKRIHIVLMNNEEHFINESEVGTNSYKQIRTAIEHLFKVDFDK